MCMHANHITSSCLPERHMKRCILSASGKWKSIVCIYIHLSKYHGQIRKSSRSTFCRNIAMTPGSYAYNVFMVIWGNRRSSDHKMSYFWTRKEIDFVYKISKSFYYCINRTTKVRSLFLHGQLYVAYWYIWTEKNSTYLQKLCYCGVIIFLYLQNLAEIYIKITVIILANGYSKPRSISGLSCFYFTSH